MGDVWDQIWITSAANATTGVDYNGECAAAMRTLPNYFGYLYVSDMIYLMSSGT